MRLNEFASMGGTSSGAIATVVAPQNKKPIKREGFGDKLNQVTDYFALSPTWVQKMLMKYELETVVRYLVTKLPEKNKKVLAQRLIRWYKKNPKDQFSNDISNIIYNMVGYSMKKGNYVHNEPGTDDLSALENTILRR